MAGFVSAAYYAGLTGKLMENKGPVLKSKPFIQLIFAGDGATFGRDDASWTGATWLKHGARWWDDGASLTSNGATRIRANQTIQFRRIIDLLCMKRT